MYTVKRWNGSCWYDSMCSPYKSYTEAMAHVKKYSWHYTSDHPYKIVSDKKPKVQKTWIKTDWEGCPIINKVMK